MVLCWVYDVRIPAPGSEERLGLTLSATALRIPQILGHGALISVVLTAFDFTGGLVGKKPESEFADEYERKEYLRRNRRRPLTETIADLGEGRGASWASSG